VLNLESPPELSPLVFVGVISGCCDGVSEATVEGVVLVVVGSFFSEKRELSSDLKLVAFFQSLFCSMGSEFVSSSLGED